jgi:predicted alpha-1,6-mannanase (GH76 family)
MSHADVPPDVSGPAVEAAVDWGARADVAARSVTRMFGQRLFFLPGTHLAAVERPSRGLRNLLRPWHYWWQAHYMDCLVDTGRRELARARKFDGGQRPSAGRLASRLVTGIRLRNLLTFVNNYYDDMAWLALATLHLDKLAEETRKPGRRRNAKALKKLALQFDSASTDDLGGGTFWNTKRDFKNTPATAPVALYYARTSNTAKAQALLDWLAAKLFDPVSGLYLDGLRIHPNGEVVLESGIYTYNQGPVLGALLELGGPKNLDRAAALIDAVAGRLTLQAALSSGKLITVLQCHGQGDGGLFTGILARYLALAAGDSRLPAESRAKAAALVLGTAEAFWEGRRGVDAEEQLARHGLVFTDGLTFTGSLVFSLQPASPAAQTYPPGAAVELSTQLQAWMTFEAAAELAHATLR